MTERNGPEHPGGVDPEEEGGFERLLEESFSEQGRLEPGQRITARVVKVTPEWVFLDLGRKGEGVLDAKELAGPEGTPAVREGDLLEAWFSGSVQNEMRFTTKISGGRAGISQLEDAWKAGIPVEGVVVKEVKGGYEVRLAGRVRGFCPFSQLGLRVEEGKSPVGSPLPFRITKFAERGRNIVLSHRVLAEEKRRAEREAARAALREGMTVQGRVTSVREFGAFVDLGGIEGMVPPSEAGWDRGTPLRELLSPGQEVEAVVTRIDREKDRISLSLKRAMADPWETAEERFPAGSTHRGTVARLAAFGAFVSLAPGVDGLLHVSKLGGQKRVKHPGEVVKPGEELEVRVESVDRQSRKISLSLPGREADRQEEEEEDFRKYLSPPSPSLGSLGEKLQEKISKKKDNLPNNKG